MKIISGNRASAVLYNWLLSNQIKGRVLIPANICESVPATYLKAGLDIEFCDIDIENLKPNEEQIVSKLSKNRIKVLHYNHTYGEDDRKCIGMIRKKFPNIYIVEDCCLSIPSFEMQDNNSDLILYSTGYTKVVNIGYGGYGLTLDKYQYYYHTLEYYESDKEKVFNEHVKKCHELKCSVDRKVIMDDWMQPAQKVKESFFADVKAEHEQIMIHKQKINRIYDGLKSTLPFNMQFWRFNILVENQSECIEKLFENHLFASKHYMSLGNGYFDDFDTPNVEWLESHVINLFNDRKYSVAQARATVDILNRYAVFCKERK